MILKKNYKLIIFSIFVILLALLISFNVGLVKIIIEKNISTYGYFAVFIFSFLTDIIMQPIGPELPGGFALILGLEFYQVFLFTLIGSYVGSLTSYFVGKKFLYSDLKKICKKKSRKKHCKFFRKHGKFALLIASISPVPYVLFCWLSGAFNLKLFDFILYGLVPRTFRIFIILFFVNLIF